MFGIRIIKEIIVEMIANNRWILCQILFAGYMVALSAEDIRKRRLPLLFLLSGTVFIIIQGFCGREISMISLMAGGAVGALFLLISRMTRILWIWGQYPDSSDGYVSRIWEYHISAYGSVFYGCCFFDSYAYKDSV